MNYMICESILACESTAQKTRVTIASFDGHLDKINNISWDLQKAFGSLEVDEI